MKRYIKNSISIFANTGILSDGETVLKIYNGNSMYAYSPSGHYDDPVVSIDKLSEEDVQELMDHADDLEEAFDYDGLYGIFGRNDRDCKIFYGCDEIINAITTDKAVAKFMDEIAEYSDYLVDDISQYMFEQLTEDSDNDAFDDKVQKTLEDPNKPFSKKCSWYVKNLK